MNISWSLTDEQTEAAMDYFDWEDLADLRSEIRCLANEKFDEEVVED